MKIEYRQGDLFTTEIELILHGTNSKGVMGSGVAKIVKEQFPSAYAAYHLWCSKGFRLGQYLAVPERNKVIINAVTQQNYGKAVEQLGPNAIRYVSYDAVAEIMHALNKAYTGSTIAMPTIGAALGGGDWSVISAIIESELKTVQPVVYIL
jgi:O-acetyl-ADP-ribose deacetylase (regulator of RNase III)